MEGVVFKESETLTGETCVFCRKKTLALKETLVDIPYLGRAHLFAMSCSTCHYSKSDVELEKNEPARYVFEVSSEEDLKVRVVRSSTGTVKIPYVGVMEPGEAADGFITNVEGLLERFKKIIEGLRDEAEDPSERRKCKNLLKKINKALLGEEKLRVIIEDPYGNSAIISEKARKEKLKS